MRARDGVLELGLVWRVSMSVISRREMHQKESCSTRQRGAGGSARVADTSHDAVGDDVADIAVVGVAGEATAAKEAFESAFDRPVRVFLAAISRVQELPREGMSVGVGHRRRIAADEARAGVGGQGFARPGAVAGSEVTLTDKCSPRAWAAGQSPAHAARARSSTSGL